MSQSPEEWRAEKRTGSTADVERRFNLPNGALTLWPNDNTVVEYWAWPPFPQEPHMSHSPLRLPTLEQFTQAMQGDTLRVIEAQSLLEQLRCLIDSAPPKRVMAMSQAERVEHADNIACIRRRLEVCFGADEELTCSAAEPS